MKKTLILICLSVIAILGSFTTSSKGYMEDKANGMRIMYYEMKVGTAQVKQNEKDMKTSIVKNGDKIYIYLTGVDGFIPKDGSSSVFPACEVTVTDINNNVLYESGNVLADAVGTRGVSIADAKFLSSNFTIGEKWPAGVYKWEVKFWDLNGPGVILSDMKITKK